MFLIIMLIRHLGLITNIFLQSVNQILPQKLCQISLLVPAGVLRLKLLLSPFELIANCRTEKNQRIQVRSVSAFSFTKSSQFQSKVVFLTILYDVTQMIKHLHLSITIFCKRHNGSDKSKHKKWRVTTRKEQFGVVHKWHNRLGVGSKDSMQALPQKCVTRRDRKNC